MEDLFKSITFYLASGIEGAAAVVIGLSAVEAVLTTLGLFFARPRRPEEQKSAIRLRLGRWLAVALEFELAADILRTAIAPSWDDIGKLAAIAALRTLLNYFLAQEVKQEAGRGAPTAPGQLDAAEHRAGAAD